MAGRWASNWDVDWKTGGATPGYESDSDGIHTPPPTAGRIRNPTAYGGYSSTAVEGPGGRHIIDTGASGQREAVSRYQGIGEAAAKREAYKADYLEADMARGQANAAWGSQHDAMRGLAAAAAGRAPSATDSLQQSSLDSGLSNTIAASAGARGMSAAAMSGQAMSTLASHNISGASSMAGMRADERAKARDAYTTAAHGLRGQDLRSLGMAEQRVNTQLDAELAQRELNQRQQMGYEGLAAGVNQAQLNAYGSSRELEAGIYENALKMREDERRRAEARIGTYASVGGAGLAAASAAYNSGRGRSDNGFDGEINRDVYGDD